MSRRTSRQRTRRARRLYSLGHRHPTHGAARRRRGTWEGDAAARYDDVAVPTAGYLSRRRACIVLLVSRRHIDVTPSTASGSAALLPPHPRWLCCRVILDFRFSSAVPPATFVHRYRRGRLFLGTAPHLG